MSTSAEMCTSARVDQKHDYAEVLYINNRLKMNHHQFNDASRGGYPAGSSYESSSGQRQRVQAAQSANPQVFGQVRDFGGFQVTNFAQKQIHEQHQPQLATDYGHFNAYGSPGGGLGSSALGPPRDDGQGVPQGHHDNDTARYGGARSSGGMQNYYLPQQQAVSSRGQGMLSSLPPYQNTLGAGAEDEQLGSQGYGNHHPQHYMHQPAAHHGQMMGQVGYNGAGGAPASHNSHPAMASSGRGGPRGAQYPGEEDYFAQYQGANEMTSNMPGLSGQYPAGQPKDTGYGARYPGSFRGANQHAQQYPGGQGGSRDSLTGPHAPLYTAGAGSQDPTGDGLANYYHPTAGGPGVQTAQGARNNYHGNGSRPVATTQASLPSRQAQIYASSVLSCDTAYTLEARSRIIDVLHLNREFKHAVKERIGFDARRARATVHRAYKQILAKRVARKLRKEGYFKATVYLETREHEEQPHPKWRVEVFGEFTAQPWQERVPCRYDPEAQCFKADITIKQGQQFKFIVDNGRKYLVSARYAISRDQHGTENNRFLPKELRWGKRERKGGSHQRTKSLYTVDRRQTTAATAAATRRYTPKTGGSTNAITNLGQPGGRPNYVGFDDLKPASPPALPHTPGGADRGTVAPGRRRSYFPPLSPVSTGRQQLDILKGPEVNPASPRIGGAYDAPLPAEPRILKSRAAPAQMQRQTGAGTAGKQESGERGYSEKPAQYSDAVTWLGSTSNKSTTLEQSPTQIKLFQDFREHFEAFYRGEPFRQRKAGGYDEPGRELRFAPASRTDSAYAYNSDDEYVDNLRQSGNFSVGAVANYKEDAGRGKAAQYQIPTGTVTDAGARQEIDYYKSFDNIFDLVEDQPAAPGEETPGSRTDPVQFHQYSFENMHKRSSGALLRQGKKKSPAVAKVNIQKVARPQAVRSPPKVTPPAQKQAATAAKRAANAGSARRQQESPRNSDWRGKASARGTTDSPPATTPGKSDGAQPQQPRSPLHGTESPAASLALVNDNQKKFQATPQGSSAPQASLPDGSNGVAAAESNSGLHEQRQSTMPVKSGPVGQDKEEQLRQSPPAGEVAAQSQQASPCTPLSSAQPQSAPIEARGVTAAEERVVAVEAVDVDAEEPALRGQSPMPEPLLPATREAPPDAGTANEVPQITGERHLALADRVDGSAQDRDGAASEISFFFDDGEEEEDDENDETANAPFILLQGAHRVGKAANQCEDAYFLLDRAFGVSDGVSGWNDYGFSSDQFSLQLMMYAKQMLEKYIKQGVKGKGSKQARSVTARGGMKRNRSLLSMDNLDIEDENDDSDGAEGAESEDDSEGNNSVTSGGQKAGSGNESGDSAKQKGKKSRGNHTERTARVESMADRTPGAGSEHSKGLTLEEEVAQKLAVVKISQEDINTWGRTDQGTEGGADLRNQLPRKDQRTRDAKRYETTLYPTYILQKAYAKVNAVGSATALIAILNKHELQIANIGDSGFLVVRFKKGEPFVPHKSKEQQHAFNIPFQLSQLPTGADLEILRRRGKREELQRLKKVLKKKNHVCQDQPDSADDYTIELKDGDVVVSATDGVFDNLFQHEVLAIIKRYRETLPGRQLATEDQATELATILAEAAVDKFKNPQGKKTPYQRKYKKTYNATWEGGKEDDITVLVSVARRVKVLSEGAGGAPTGNNEVANPPLPLANPMEAAAAFH